MMPAGVTWLAPGRCRNMTGATVLAAVVYGLLLGVKHALDADHIVAVTAIVSRSRSLLHSLLVGLRWGIGHTITLFIVGFAVLVFKLEIPVRLALLMEFAVGVILVLQGAAGAGSVLMWLFTMWQPRFTGGLFPA